MYKYTVTVVFFTMFSLFGAATMAGASFDWQQYRTLKITFESEEKVFEWEYENPSSFEYEEENTIWRGETARKSFENILAHFDLNEAVITDETAAKFERMYFGPPERIVIHSVDGEDNARTWHWRKS
ncbi:hypothetical protein [Evansella clarkii]|uniref:hypothetical protein n=1 Tax=Evansella clarkii TaxID=79879 RepID=UPI0009974195|nr:hypothetical protein [Evansella clarkii]